MKLKLILATLALVAGCAVSSGEPVAVKSAKTAPKAATADVLQCRGGYHVATRADGSEYCEQDS